MDVDLANAVPCCTCPDHLRSGKRRKSLIFVPHRIISAWYGELGSVVILYTQAKSVASIEDLTPPTRFPIDAVSIHEITRLQNSVRLMASTSRESTDTVSVVLKADTAQLTGVAYSDNPVDQ